MKIEHLIIVLGKRLQKDKLTAEGRSRVNALIDYIATNNMEKTVIGFCGGVTSRQTRSEAQVMYEYYLNQASAYNLLADHIPVLLEQLSTSTIENIRHLAIELIKSDLILENSAVQVTFVSNDYHLERIFEIQHYLDEQGLLKTLKATCLSSGLRLNIPYQLERHVCVPYPTKTMQAELFLAIEALTTYRVYLEGVVANSFTRKIEEVRHQPLRVASNAFECVDSILTKVDNIELANDFANKCTVVRSIMPLLKQSVESTAHDKPRSDIVSWLATLDVNLTMLNRLLDPETDPDSRWWK
ncbi:YdcF family protein [Vibrio tapetis subsp. quintayensis]|uniref:YdcF family protein n=1 Tax=Vibrio tapetis TaxID=52443 RepID=UPI0025B311A7|nr:YdcF family protein [Vibrio tapetis]MDN3680640.1 YdcF family protein [Vibrio tapetis subsp. quintayensis]